MKNRLSSSTPIYKLPQGIITMGEVEFMKRNPYYTKVKFPTDHTMQNPLSQDADVIVNEYMWVDICTTFEGFGVNSDQRFGFGILDNIPEYCSYVKYGDKITYKTFDGEPRPTFVSVVNGKLTKLEAESLIREN